MDIKNDKLIVFLLFFTLISLSISVVSATDHNASGNFSNVQNAINLADSGDTIILTDNVQYEGTGYGNGIQIKDKNNITIDGKGFTIDGTSIGGNKTSIFEIFNSNNIVIKNITLVNAYADQHGGAIYNEADYVTLMDVNIFNCEAMFGGGIYNSGNHFTLAGNVHVNDNTAVFEGAGIYNTGDNFTINGFNEIDNNSIIYDGSESRNLIGGGIYNSGDNFLINGSNIISNNYLSYTAYQIYHGLLLGGGIYNSGNNFIIRGSNKIISNGIHYSSRGQSLFNSTIYGGGISNINGTNFIIEGNNNISYNYAINGSGAGISNINGSNFVIEDNNYISYNFATLRGGGIYNSAEYFNINGNNYIIHNTAQNGGGIYNNGFDNIADYFTIQGFNHIDYNEHKNGRGGGIFNSGGNYFLIYGNNSLSYNYGDGDGGAILNENGDYFTIYGNNTLNYNTARLGGSISTQGGSYFLIYGNNTFDYNNVISAALYISDTNNFTISGKNSFSYNNASYAGGAIYTVISSNILITGNNIIYKNIAYGKDSLNRSTGWGGAFYHQDTANFTISGNNVIANNTARVDGGGFYFNQYHDDQTNYTITGNNIIANNTALEGNGGAIHNDANNNFYIIGSNVISNNSALKGNGGAIYNRDVNFTISGSNSITNNSALNGGAIFNDYDMYIDNYYNVTYIEAGDNFTIIGSNIISNNHATKKGGGMYNRANNFTISGSNVIADNTAYDGGGIYIDYYTYVDENGTETDFFTGNNFTIFGNNVISNNLATNNGGGVYNANNTNFTIEGKNKIVNNSASNGGGVYNNGGINFTIIGDNHFNYNSASGKGGAIFNDGSMFVLGASFINNTGANGTAIYNIGNLSVLNGKFIGYSHFIFNDVGGILFLNNNTMSSNYIEKIYNLGLIISEVYVIYLHNTTIFAYLGENLILNATVTDDMGNVIVGQNVTFVVESIVSSTDIDKFKDGYYHMAYIASQTGTYIVNGTYRGGNNLTILNGIITVRIVSNLDLNKIVSESKVIIGSEVTYTITVINYGPNNASNVYVIDKLPDGIVFISSIASKGSYDLSTGRWNIGDLANGESVTLTIVVKANNIGNFTNFATVYSDSYNPSENGTNPSDTVTFEVVEEPTPGPTPTPTPSPSPEPISDDIKYESNVNMEKTGNPILILLLVLISGLIIPLRRKS